MSDANELDAEQRVEEIADAYLDQLQRGESPDRTALLAAHPDIAEPLAKQLDFVDLMHRAQQAVASTDTSSAAESLALPEPAPALAAPVPDRIGRYHILEALGRGAAGTVYRAYDPKFDRDVALKVLRSDRSMCTETIQRFEREARIVAQLRHPYIVPFHELGESDGFRYLDMELIAGETLEQRLATAPLDFRAAADLVQKLAEALDYAHRNGIIHRDVKPSNILLSGERRVVSQTGALLPLSLAPPQITDFGLAHRAAGEATLTEEGQIIGTLAYMSPEQAQGGAHQVDGRSDVYSLGAVLYRLLTGRVPFPDGDSFTAQLYQIAHVEPPKPRSLNAAVPRDLETICLKAMAKDPADRFATAGTFAEELRRWLNDEPLHVRPPRLWEQAWRWARRDPVSATLLAALLVALSSGLAAVTGLWFRAEDLRHHAEESAELARQHLYVSDVKLAYEAWKNADLSQALDRLARHRPAPGQKDLRGFAWYYVWRLCHAERRTLTGHTDEVLAVAYSPDGTQLATADKAGLVILWDAAPGREQRRLRGHKGDVNGVAFSPDGKTLATAGDDETVRLWDTATGNSKAVLKGHRDDVMAVAFSPDGRTLASGGVDRQVRLWDTATEKVRATLDGHQHTIWSLAFTADGRKLATASSDQTIKLWDLASGKASAVLTGHTLPVRCLAWSPDGTTLATGSEDLTVRLWDIGTGREKAVLAGHSNWVRTVAFAADGTSLASGSEDGTVRIWNWRTPAMRHVLRGHVRRIWGVAFAPDSKSLATVSGDCTVKIWNSAQRQDCSILESTPDMGSITSLAFAPDGKTLAAGSGRRRLVRSWTIPEGRFQDVEHEQSDTVSSLAFTPDGTTLLVGLEHGTLILRDRASGRDRLVFPAHQGTLNALAVSPDSRLVATAGNDRRVNLWDLTTGQLRATYTGHITGVFGVAFSPRGDVVVSGSNDSTARLWDLQSGKERPPPLRHKDAIRGVAFSPDGTLLATASRDRTAKLWQMDTGAEWATLQGHKDTVSAVAFCPDGRTLATASHDGTVKLWDLATRQEVLTLEGHRGRVDCLAFSRDGKVLATGGGTKDGAGELYLWLAGTGDE